MSAIPMMTVTPSGAAAAYARTGAGDASGTDFGAALGQAVDSLVSAGKDADAQSARAIQGAGNYTEVATAVSRAELALQSAVAIRDKVVQAYQDVMRMSV